MYRGCSGPRAGRSCQVAGQSAARRRREGPCPALSQRAWGAARGPCQCSRACLLWHPAAPCCSRPPPQTASACASVANTFLLLQSSGFFTTMAPKPGRAVSYFTFQDAPMEAKDCVSFEAQLECQQGDLGACHLSSIGASFGSPHFSACPRCGRKLCTPKPSAAMGCSLSCLVHSTAGLCRSTTDRAPA